MVERARFREETLHAVLVSHVDREAGDARASVQFAGGSLQLFLGTSGDDDIASFVKDSSCRGQADAGGSTNDECACVVQFHFVTIALRGLAVQKQVGMIQCPERMELRHLHSFLALSEELHFGRAAERLGIAQPALSRQIQQLETEVGGALFERDSRSVRLTRAGDELLARVKVHVEGIASAFSAARAVNGGGAGRLRVGYVSNLSYRLLPAVLKKLKESCPGAAFDLHENTTDGQLQALRSGEIDLALVVLPVEAPEMIQRVLFQDPLVLVMPTDHPLSAQETVALSQLREYSFVMCPRYQRAGVEHVIFARCAELRFEPKVVQEVQGKTLLYELIARGVGLSIVPHSSSFGDRKGVVYRPISDSLRPIEIGAVWRRDRDQPLRKTFVDTAVRVSRPPVTAPARAVA